MLIKREKNFIGKFKKNRFNDFWKRESGSKMTLLSKSCFLILENVSGKNYGLNFIDTPGHFDFFDEVRNCL